MRPEIAAADRNFAVRRAAARWRKAGEIDPATEAAIAALHPDDRVRTSKIFRVLFFVFTWFGYSTASGFGLAFLSAAGVDWDDTGAFCFVIVAAGAAMLGVAEWLTAGLRLRCFGIEEACAWIGWSHLIGGGLFWLLEGLDFPPAFVLVAGAWLSAGCAGLIVWRWATPGMGAVATVAVFVAISQAPWNHLVWLLVGAILAWPLAHLSVAAHVSPEHRKRFGEAFVVAVLMLYAAVHVTVVELRGFVHLRLADQTPLWGEGSAPTASDWAVGVSLLAMVAVPAALLAAGILRRHRTAIVLGLILTAVTGATFAHRFGSGPLWLRLILEGGALVALALWLRRALARRAGAEWRGLTALPLLEDRESLASLEVLATLATLTPAARQPATEGLAGGGGEFGGGGASAKF